MLPWEALLWGSLAVVALLLVLEGPPPLSGSSMLPPLLHPAPQPFLNLGTNTGGGGTVPRPHQDRYFLLFLAILNI